MIHFSYKITSSVLLAYLPNPRKLTVLEEMSKVMNGAAEPFVGCTELYLRWEVEQWIVCLIFSLRAVDHFF